MTSAHILYIPMAVTVGMFLGFILGARAARKAGQGGSGDAAVAGSEPTARD